MVESLQGSGIAGGLRRVLGTATQLVTVSSRPL